ncbi:hypothetical protein [Parafrankia sp. FMc2]|uniref:hypothetical protein n=1 Tax=Parafrankia sp. FMc2 TaxID=3233196 RepID=UPI0034D74246
MSAMDRDEDLRPGESVEAWVRRMAGLSAIDAAEFYAAGGRRLTIHHPGLERLPRDVHDVIDAAADQAGYTGGGGAGTLGALPARRTRWSWPGGHGGDPAAIVAAATVAARQIVAGTGWTLEADAP